MSGALNKSEIAARRSERHTEMTKRAETTNSTDSTRRGRPQARFTRWAAQPERHARRHEARDPLELEATAIRHLPRPDQRGSESVLRRVAEQAVLCRGDGKLLAGSDCRSSFRTARDFSLLPLVGRVSSHPILIVCMCCVVLAKTNVCASHPILIRCMCVLDVACAVSLWRI